MNEPVDRYAQLLQRLEANEREFRRLGRSVLRVQEDERRRLARELHDGVGQNLTALKHRLAQLRDAADVDPTLRDALDAAVALCADTLEDTRELSRLLRPTILDDLGLEPALRWLGRSVGQAAGISIAVEVEPLPPLDGERETLLFRVAQEALNNIAKHAQARSVLMRVVERDGRLQLQIVDDGVGFDPSLRAAGSGLSGMRERLRLFAGTLEVHSAPGDGTRLRAVVPLDA
ncbi:sensor histidine kinase [Lysobacter sp. TY2-98]|uniref:sensor histidine kinase n=1 Tax=Lysobacter sp. TY2-98 TaxID=2290922 RepID=UPI000E208CA2|nr:sensor histidine kinase [Lysobacter sp. TY2-98]AXK71515.1 sensor histidine kinase [Lysobacter sp. TY2-98]